MAAGPGGYGGTGDDGYRELLARWVDAAALGRMVRYAELLERWSAHHSLVRFSTREELVRRHLLEAMAAAPLLGEAGRLVDVGSGAGLPGVPLLVVKVGWSGVLIEPRVKRWAFLRQVVRELSLPAEVVALRYEEVEEAPCDAITVRALTVDPPFLAWARARLVEAGRLLVWTTEEGVSRLATAPGWRVLSSPLPASRHGRIAQLHPCST
jgi:16S rRNA (guanine527-N7)-methyltransferase